jgi:hypothetical protein
MQDNYIECPELAGKTIQMVRIYRDVGDGTSVQIELTDGTNFTCSVSVRPDVEASLYKGGVGTPETLRAYELWAKSAD